jgi:CheY-like chemotaxis protein
MFVAGGGGTSLRVEAQSSATPNTSEEAEEAAGVYLPWTARPWAVTHSVHHAQWKFLDTVFAHLATVTPAELSERAREQGARDVLCDLEEPVMALRRQQARQQRQQRRQEKTAKLAAASASVTPTDAAAAATKEASTTVPLQVGAVVSADPFSSLMSTSLSSVSTRCNRSSVGVSGRASFASSDLSLVAGEPKKAADGEEGIHGKSSARDMQCSSRPSRPPADSFRSSTALSASAAIATTVTTSSSAANEEGADTVHDAHAVSASSQSSPNTDADDSTKTAGREARKKSKKQKRGKKAVDVIHYL